MLIATHDIALIERMGHRRLILDHGTLSDQKASISQEGIHGH